jgi:Flp pilus assembly protein TadG
MARKSFLTDVKGNMALMMAVTAVPLMVASGAAIDMVRANNAQTILQGAVDSAALAGGTSKLSNTDDVQTLVTKYLNTNGEENALTTVSHFDSGKILASGNFYVKVEGKVNNYFLGLVGMPTTDIGAYSEVEIGGMAVELALVLDNTASMNSQGRLTALKASAKNLVDTIMNNKPAGAYVKIGIVPFSNYVNVGMSNRFKNWIDVPADYTETVAATSTSYPNATYSNCHLVDHPYSNDGVPAVWQENVCDVNPGTLVTNFYYPSHSWSGCVGSRNNGLDTKIVGLGNKYPGLMDTGCSSAITDLTDVKSTLDSQIDAMNAVGETYIPSGLLWGWNMLDSNEPLSGAKTKAEMTALKGSKSLVLMTDGDNTLSANYPYHNGNDAAAADAKTAELCENIKAEGITIFTVGFKVSKPSSVAMLSACASNPTQAFAAEDDAALMSAFNQIALAMSQVRVAK